MFDREYESLNALRAVIYDSDVRMLTTGVIKEERTGNYANYRVYFFLYL